MQVQITQQELQEIHELEREVAPKLARIEELKSNVKVLLISKMPVELGRFDVRLLKRFQRHVPWRQCVVELQGPAFAEAYKKKFPVQMFCEVQVEEHSTAPLWKNGADSTEIH